ncbi:MAG: DUF4388 domain-containing protein [Anaerolineales bacterium]
MDDDISSLRSLVTLLEDHHYNVYATGEKGEAMDIYSEGEIDIALIALDMKAISGFEVLSMLKAYDPQAKAILYTDYGTKEHVVKALRLGASEFVEKPLRMESLLPIFDRLQKEAPNEKAFQGTLRTMSLASIIQMNCEERIVGALHLRQQGKVGRIFFDGGQVVHAETGNLFGEEAVYQLLEWDQGMFSLEMGATPPRRTINAEWSGLILEGMRRIDEDQVMVADIWQDTDLDREEKEEGAFQEVAFDVKERIRNALMRIEGVRDVLICNGNGNIIANEKEEGVEKAGAIANYVIQQAEKLGLSLSGSQIKRVLLTTEHGKEMILRDEDDIIYMWVSKRLQADLLAHEVRATILRYQS